MFTNFLKVTIRNLYREKMYAVINIAGLSIAIACCIILSLYLKSELTYDRHNKDYQRIFRVVNEVAGNNSFSGSGVALTSSLLGPMLAEEYPEINGFVRFREIGTEVLIHHGERAFYWEKIYFADANVFDVFTHEIIYGDPDTALVDSSSIAVSESFAKKYFGDINPVGEIVIDVEHTYKITLVFKDLPENTHLRYDALFSYNSDKMAMNNSRQNLWMMSDYTFLLMPEGYDKEAFKDISDSFYLRHMSESNPMNDTWQSWLQPLADIHLKSEAFGDQPTANKYYLYGFSAVALFILLVACINYMNLSTARAVKRVKETGMRKILGAGRIGLALHFLGESIVLALISLFLGVVLVEIALKLTPINSLLNKPLVLNLSHEPGLLVWMLLFGLAIGVLSGIYPAFYLSSMPSLSILMKGNRTGKGNIRLREMLLLMQFIITVSIMACTMFMISQMRYVSHKSLGFNKENRIIITLRGKALIEKIPTIKNDLLKNSNILGITASSNMIGQMTNMSLSSADNNDGVMEETVLSYILVDEDFLDVMGMDLLKGRNFSGKLLTDSGSSFIVNEEIVKNMGWKEPIGKHIQTGPFFGQVIGVLRDFHFHSLHSQIEPFALLQFSAAQGSLFEEWINNERFFILNVSGEGIPETLKFLKEKFEQFDPEHPFHYEFLDESLDKLYTSDQRLMKLIGIFAGICIFISCIGLFGLEALTTEQRTKEIGIRKVLGASTWQIIVMLAHKILLLVLGGAVIASLIAYYTMDEWLTSFAYRIGINPFVFLLSALLAAGVAFITVALQSYKTARANPVEALRYE